MEEVLWTMEKIKEFEESIPTIWLPEQLEAKAAQEKEFEEATA